MSMISANDLLTPEKIIESRQPVPQLNNTVSENESRIQPCARSTLRDTSVANAARSPTNGNGSTWSAANAIGTNRLVSHARVTVTIIGDVLAISTSMIGSVPVVRVAAL
jgi:hypothetical protein